MTNPIREQLEEIFDSITMGMYISNPDENSFSPVKWEESPLRKQYIDQLESLFTQEQDKAIKRLNIAHAAKLANLDQKHMVEQAVAVLRGKADELKRLQAHYDNNLLELSVISKRLSELQKELDSYKEEEV